MSFSLAPMFTQEVSLMISTTATPITEKIPMVNLQPFIDGDPDQQQQVAQQIYQACHEIGFLYLTGFGIDQLEIDTFFEQVRWFFALPTELKNSLSWRDHGSNRGYSPLESERLDPSLPGDLKEGFNVGKEGPILHPATAYDHPNLWPPEADAFRERVLSFFESASMATQHILRAFALALQLPVDYFASRHDRQHFILRMLHYPPLPEHLQAGQTRAAAHTDYGSITLLFQDSVGGLEVRNQQGEWIPAPWIPGAILVNTGDLMQRWTNHEFCSTPHRVVLPTGPQVQRSRYSTAFVVYPNFDAEIACVGHHGRDPLYPPILTQDYVLGRLQATY
ncbi:MAG: 2-oxoglutarate and iron-dependent oxygenase domain-containing protein [Cyanobacteriota bacterium]